MSLAYKSTQYIRMPENTQKNSQYVELMIYLQEHKTPYRFGKCTPDEVSRMQRKLKRVDQVQWAIYLPKKLVWGVSVNRVMILPHTQSISEQLQDVRFISGTSNIGEPGSQGSLA